MALIEFKNKPNTDTPINDKNLNHNFSELDLNIDELEKNSLYTSEEQVIGTLMGKPLYRKVGSIIFPSVYVSGNYTRGSYINGNMEHISISKTFITAHGAHGFYQGRNETEGTSIYVENSGADKGYILGFTNKTYYVNTPIYVVVEYTKTTETD